MKDKFVGVKEWNVFQTLAVIPLTMHVSTEYATSPYSGSNYTQLYFMPYRITLLS